MFEGKMYVTFGSSGSSFSRFTCLAAGSTSANLMKLSTRMERKR